MTYELAKKLKDAGFPYGQYSFNVFYLEQDCPPYDEYQKEIKEKGVGNLPWTIGVPTLSELIEACGEGFENLYYSDTDLWECNRSWVGEDDCGSESEGKTPEEAVANLWLSLKK